MAIHRLRRRFTVAEYEQMGRAGIFDEDDRVELLDGEIVEMTPIGNRHAGGVDRVAHLFFQRFGDVAQVRVQNPVVLDQRSEPQPDLTLLRPRADFYASAHPVPSDIVLIVEVAESSAAVDRRVKVPLYARNGVPEVWLVRLDQGAVVVYRDPSPTGYRSVQTLRRGQSLAPVSFPDRTVSVDSLLG